MAFTNAIYTCYYNTKRGQTIFLVFIIPGAGSVASVIKTKCQKCKKKTQSTKLLFGVAVRKKCFFY